MSVPCAFFQLGVSPPKPSLLHQLGSDSDLQVSCQLWGTIIMSQSLVRPDVLCHFRSLVRSEGLRASEVLMLLPIAASPALPLNPFCPHPVSWCEPCERTVLPWAEDMTSFHVPELLEAQCIISYELNCRQSGESASCLIALIRKPLSWTAFRKTVGSASVPWLMVSQMIEITST